MIREIHLLTSAQAAGSDSGKQASALRDQLQAFGFSAQIHWGQPAQGFAPDKNALMLYLASTATEALSQFYLAASGHKAIFYWGTPPDHFSVPYRELSSAPTPHNELARLAGATRLSFADSEFAQGELRALGFSDPQILPPTLDLSSLESAVPDPELSAVLGDGKANFLCAGPLSPEKRQEDTIRAFSWYHRMINPSSRLICLGEATFLPYREDLLDVCYTLGIQDSVFFLGNPTPVQLAAIYQGASVLISMSEYEGFCGPLLEAAQFGIPTLSFAATGVAETLGESGVRFQHKDMPMIAELAHLLVTDMELRSKVILGQRQRLERLRADNNPGSVFKTAIEELAP